jgi:hypothetical protein
MQTPQEVEGAVSQVQKGNNLRLPSLKRTKAFADTSENIFNSRSPLF